MSKQRFVAGRSDELDDGILRSFALGDSPNEALAAYKQEYPGRDDPPQVWNAIEFDGPELFPDVESLLEQAGDTANAEAGEASEGWLFYVPKDAKETLERRYIAMLSDWLDECGLRPTFFGVRADQGPPMSR